MEENFTRLQRTVYMLKKARQANKEKENALKPPLVSNDVRETADFVFSTKAMGDDGDSGQLLLAKRKTDRNERYLVKHEFTDCAANEFVYTKLVQAMGYPMPDAKLFRISKDEKRRHFKTEYVVGTRYLEVKEANPSEKTILEHAVNWKDMFSFYAMEMMFAEDDGTEFVLTLDNILYRVDTTSSFCIGDDELLLAGANREANGINPDDMIKEQIFSKNLDRLLRIENFNWMLDKQKSKHGEICVAPYLEPFVRIRQISDDYIDEFLDTLCYFYPDYIGSYYKNYISVLRNKSWLFLDSLN